MQRGGLDPQVFRRYDVRGRVGDQITPELAYGVGLAVGTRIRRGGATSAVVGHDMRHSSPGLAERAAQGLADAGLRVAHLGQVPTPVVYHAIYRLDQGGGIVVTGSHNPKSDNGLKICIGKSSIFGEAVATLRGQIETGDLARSAGGSIDRVDYLPRYVQDIASRFRFGRRLAVAVDTGNGVMGPIVVPMLERLGCSVAALFVEPDGDFPNHLPDPEVPQYMADLGRCVRERRTEVGLGFDGDGDRVGVLDETGRKISADWLIALFARALLAQYPGGKVRYDVKCTEFLAVDIRAHGGVPVMGETGHSLLKRDVAEMDAILGGELSGHILFNRGYLPIDDSLYCALRFLELLDRSGGKTSELFRGFPDLVSTPEIKVPCADERKFDVVAGLVASFRADGDRFRIVDIDGARVSLPSGAWFLVRASNTTPCLTVRIEANDEAEMTSLRALLDDRLARFDCGPLDHDGRPLH